MQQKIFFQNLKPFSQVEQLLQKQIRYVGKLYIFNPPKTSILGIWGQLLSTPLLIPFFICLSY